jgi:ubiquinone/menaquinone biosynthesis C-methylase UbiE
MNKRRAVFRSSFIAPHSSFAVRSTELEHLDKGDYTAEEYEGCLVELRRINRFLGDASALRKTLLRRIERDGENSFSVLDVGAGSGELLRVVAVWARRKEKRARLFGLELNARSARAIAEESEDFPEIAAVRGDAFRLPFDDDEFDYAMCSLFTHHFADEDVVRLLRELDRVTRRGVAVIDLHRHRIAYLLYTTLGRLVLRNRLTREDGALSIRRSFRPAELRALAERAGFANARITRRFPFRIVLEAGKHRQKVLS